MKRVQTKAIVLKRTNYGEADRIVQLYTAQAGKLSAIAKGVRKPRSKLAGGLELLSVCDIGLIKSKSTSDLYTVVSSRIDTHFDRIVRDFTATQRAYLLLKLLALYTDEEPDQEYFQLISTGLSLLNQAPTKADIATCWYIMQLLKLHGGPPNLVEDHQGKPLEAIQRYSFSIEDGMFFASEVGQFSENQIKAWRVFLQASPQQVMHISGLEEPAEQSLRVLEQFALFQA